MTSGMLEGSNVNGASTLINLISAQRQFDMQIPLATKRGSEFSKSVTNFDVKLKGEKGKNHDTFTVDRQNRYGCAADQY